MMNRRTGSSFASGLWYSAGLRASGVGSGRAVGATRPDRVGHAAGQEADAVAARQKNPPENTSVRIKVLEDHAAPYVTVEELAAYWRVSRKLIYNRVSTGELPAVRFGPRLLRVRTSEAIKFERARLSLALAPSRPTRLALRHIQKSAGATRRRR